MDKLSIYMTIIKFIAEACQNFWRTNVYADGHKIITDFYGGRTRLEEVTREFHCGRIRTVVIQQYSMRVGVYPTTKSSRGERIHAADELPPSLEDKVNGPTGLRIMVIIAELSAFRLLACASNATLKSTLVMTSPLIKTNGSDLTNPRLSYFQAK
jgi:hypothetical protein